MINTQGAMHFLKKIFPQIIKEQKNKKLLICFSETMVNNILQTKLKVNIIG
jgi:hypothetical protein